MQLMRTATALLLLSCATAPKTQTPAELSFSLPNLAGAVLTPADYAGRVLLVDLWATWCKPCLESFPYYSELAERHREAGLTILAVSVDERVEDVRAFLEARPVPFEILLDPAGSLPSALDLKTMPTAVLVGRDGRVLHVHDGFREADKPDIERRIVEALAAR